MRFQALLSPGTLPLIEERPSGLKGLGCVRAGDRTTLSHTLAPITTFVQGPSWLGPLLAVAPAPFMYPLLCTPFSVPLY